MDQLWSPWRSQYIDSFSDDTDKKSACFLCDAAGNPHEDTRNLVVARRDHCFVIMNRYPYNAGHILVAPMQHTGDINALDPDIFVCIMQTVQEAAQVLTNVFSPDGINIGANLGRAAGAGIPDHIHFHLVPRWNGDTNFMATFADVKVISSALEDGCRKLAQAFAQQ